eukprot:8840018-Karenia_brevis.AAC.1
MQSLCFLGRKCPGIKKGHQHEHAWGSRRVQGRAVNLSASAGDCPMSRCNGWAKVVSDCVENCDNSVHQHLCA